MPDRGRVPAPPWNDRAAGAVLDRSRYWVRTRSLARRPASDLARTRGGHGVVVSVTSIAPRFGTLHLALRSLIDQSVPASSVVLWVRPDELGLLPSSVTSLVDHGVDIRVLERDLGPASKLIPALEAHPDSTIVTADDDVAYQRRWLERLLSRCAVAPGAIVCARAHWLTFDDAGGLRPYGLWEHETRRSGPDDRLFFTGHGGVLYPPGVLPDTARDATRLLKVCPTADDLWFNWMARLAGTPVARVPHRAQRHGRIAGSQSTTLMRDNLSGGNDRQLLALQREFGTLDPATGSLVGGGPD